MWRLALPISIFLMAWTGATGIGVPAAELEGQSIVRKRVATSMPERVAQAVPAAETTEQATMLAEKIAGELAVAAPAVAAAASAIEPAAVVAPAVRRKISRREVCATLATAAQSNGLPIPFFIRLIWQESGFNPQAVSRAGAQGVAQFMPGTAAERGLADPFDPLQALPAAARLLRDLFRQFGNLGLAAAAYNAGPQRILDWQTKRGKLPQETRDYVRNITGHAPERWKVAAAGPIELKVPKRAPCQHEAVVYAANDPRGIPLPAPRTKAAAVKIAAHKEVAAAAPKSNRPLHLAAHQRLLAKSLPEKSKLASKSPPAKPVRVAMELHAARK